MCVCVCVCVLTYTGTAGYWHFNDELSSALFLIINSVFDTVTSVVYFCYFGTVTLMRLLWYCYFGTVSLVLLL